jgi:hypothetical protein
VGLDRFRDADFANMSFIWNKPVANRARVYNLEVADYHTYFVGEGGAWVHNKGNTPVLTPGFPDLATATTRTRLADYPYFNDTAGKRTDTAKPRARSCNHTSGTLIAANSGAANACI